MYDIILKIHSRLTETFIKGVLIICPIVHKFKIYSIAQTYIKKDHDKNFKLDLFLTQKN